MGGMNRGAPASCGAGTRVALVVLYPLARVRGGEYGTEVDVYSLGKLLRSVAGRISTSQLNGLLMQMHGRCTQRLPSLRRRFAAHARRSRSVGPRLTG